MTQAYQIFRTEVLRLAQRWQDQGMPSHQGLQKETAKLDALRNQLKVRGLWDRPPCMVTATLDDGLGQGLAIIETVAAAIGIRLVSLGLMRTSREIVEACLREKPEFLGLTILQFDTEEELVEIVRQLPEHTRIIAGGPVFLGDADFAARTGTHYAARNAADFLRFMANVAATADRG